jgi:hypothetical protein
VRSLVDLQDAFAQAMTGGQSDGIAWGHVASVAANAHRLAIHSRHYEASLTAALCEKFPACAWLAGTEVVREAACAYAHATPPRQPCIAEYGADFPQFLASHRSAAALPYLGSFAALEWAVAQTSLAIDSPPVTWSTLSGLGPERLLDSTLSLQPGLRYLSSRWRVDGLMTIYLRGAEPERFTLDESPTHMEIRGARGDVAIARLDAAAFRFRAELAAGRSIANAADYALASRADFDAGEALRDLARTGLVVRVHAPLPESPQ